MKTSTFRCSRCREPDLTEFLIEDALENQAARLSVTRIVSFEGKNAGFFTLTNDCIIRKGVSDDDGEEGYPYPHYPALKIARLATHQEFEGGYRTGNVSEDDLRSPRGRYGPQPGAAGPASP